MKIAIVGASGRAGSCITAELARRGHSVTGIARNPDKIARLANVTAVSGDANDRAALARLWAGHDAAVSSIHFLTSDIEALIGAARDSGVPRYLVVGGAGSLESRPECRWWRRRTSRRHTRRRPKRAGRSWTGCGRKGS